MIVSESWASVLVGREDRAIRPPSKEKHYPLVFSICHEELPIPKSTAEHSQTVHKLTIRHHGVINTNCHSLWCD
jgi:hypothetical protein